MNLPVQFSKKKKNRKPDSWTYKEYIFDWFDVFITYINIEFASKKIILFVILDKKKIEVLIFDLS